MREKSQPNIYDIARQAGVSIATVSRVLSGSGKVRQSTRERVEQVMAATGYKPNAFARGLGLGSMKMVGILCTDVSDTFCGTAVSALERLLRQSGLDTLLCCTGHSLTEKKRFIEYLLEKRVDAIILVGSAFKETDDNRHIEKAAESVPVIIINGLVECPGVYCVLCDEKNAMRGNVHALYEENCRKILYLYNAVTYSGTQKLGGYRQGLYEAGLEDDESLVVRCGSDPWEISQQLIGLVGSGLYFDSILAADDIIAVGACKALAKIGRRLPVIGFNNSLLSRCASPEISSVDNRAVELCEKAVEVLADLLGKRPDVPQKIVLEARLVRRETF